MSAKPMPRPLPPWGSAVAGATGAVLANAMVYPLDIVKTRLQVQIKHRPSSSSSTTIVPPTPSTTSPEEAEHYTSTLDALSKILSSDGLPGLYSGLSSSLLGVASTNFAYFYWYSIVRTLYSSYQRRHLSLALSAPLPPPSTAIELSLGALAGAIAQVFTIPVAVITTRQQTASRRERKKGLVETGREVVESEDGWTGLWRGLKASLVLVVNPAITYGAYERLRIVFFGTRTRLRPWEAFFLGALSKSLATLATQPLIVAKVGLQSRPPPSRNGKPFKTFGEVMAFVVHHEGLFALFKGIGPQITKGLLVQGVLMMVKERVEILFSLLFAYVRTIRAAKLQQAAEMAASRAKMAVPVLTK